MRVTNKMLANNFLRDMTANLNNMQKLQTQLSTGKEFSKPSDNPFAVARSMQMNSEIDANKQYNSNIKDTINWLDTTDTALGQIGNVFQSIREKLVSAGSAAYSQDERQKIKDEINQRVSQISQILNTNFDGEYIFGGSRATTKPVDSKNDGTNTTLVYNSKDGNELATNTTVESEVVKSLDTNWSGKTITFSIDGVDKTPIKLSTFKATDKIGSLVTDINQQIETNKDLSGKVVAEATEDGKVAFKVLSDQNGKDYNVAISSTDLTANEISGSMKGQTIPSMQLHTISSKRSIEISKGVTMDYNVTAADIMSFKDKNGNFYDLRTVLNKIVTDLGDPTKTNDLTTTDLSNLDATMANLLKIRSEVGAKGNRMDSAKEQNEQANQDMTEILSKTEDIDITEKTMDYATMQTVYLASLQTSAKVLQPTLMDYVR
jgi:flagellar hook-associated protein 3 FlgL